MFAFLEKFKKKPVKQAYSIPSSCRVYAVGDIHGRADLLGELQNAIFRDARDSSQESNLIVYLGDYLDRGPYVRQTLEQLHLDLPPGFEARYLMGNHEELFLAFLRDPSVLEPWLELGGQMTLLSYGLRPPGFGCTLQRAEEVRQELWQAVPEKHLAFLRNLETSLQCGDYFFVHAGIRPGVPLEKQKPEDMCWIRDPFLSFSKDHGLRVVHGHTVQEEVQEHPNRIGVDTGAYATGILTCAVIEDSRLRYLSTASGPSS